MYRINLLLCITLALACGPRGPEVTSEGTTTTNDSTFVPDNDTAGYSHCDPFQQDCPPGEKCVPVASTGDNWDANECVPIVGDDPLGDACTHAGPEHGADSCDGTSLCWNLVELDGELHGTCVSQCTGSPDDPMCPDGSSCTILSGGAVNVCLNECDPILQDCGGLACHWNSETFVCMVPTYNWGAGEACGQVQDCAAGLVCASETGLPLCEGFLCCAEYCDVGDPPCGPPGTECRPLFDAQSEWAHVGVCVVSGA